MSHFLPSFHFLFNETLLAEGALATGLTAIRKGDRRDRGALYCGFFQLSIGFERLFKLIIVLDYMQKHAMRGPDDKWLRQNFRHKLLTMLDAIEQLPAASGVLFVDRSSRSYELLSFLADFAEASRYYNLDALAASAKIRDPLKHWYEIVRRLVEDEMPPEQKLAINRQANALGQVLGTMGMTFTPGLDGKTLDAEDLAREPSIHDFAAPRVIRHLYEVLQPTRKVLCSVGESTSLVSQAAGESQMAVPHFSEMLTFLLHAPSDVLRKKRWP